MLRHPTTLMVALSILVSVSLAAGCSKSDKSTNPYGGGGGTAPEMSSGNIVAGATYPHRFFVAKTYPYHCSIHPMMTGSIIVSASVPAGDSLGAVTIMNFSFSPNSVTIPVGGKVTWTNDPAGVTHTVTSDP